jgi:hypothetical protein
MCIAPPDCLASLRLSGILSVSALRLRFPAVPREHLLRRFLVASIASPFRRLSVTST